MNFQLAGTTVVYTPDDALATVNRYCFATTRIVPTDRFPDAFPPHDVPLYGYRTYDCVPPSASRDFTDLDLLVGAGLNARLDMPALARLRSFADRAANSLEYAHQLQPDFLKYDRQELGDNPPPDTAGWHLYQAWLQGMATPGLDVARVHKTLHHKRSLLVPLLDNKTITPIRDAAVRSGSTVWQQIHHEIHLHSQQFDDLATAVNHRLMAENLASLTWLRLYDILLWMHLKKERL